MFRDAIVMHSPYKLSLIEQVFTDFLLIENAVDKKQLGKNVIDSFHWPLGLISSISVGAPLVTGEEFIALEQGFLTEDLYSWGFHIDINAFS